MIGHVIIKIKKKKKENSSAMVHKFMMVKYPKRTPKSTSPSPRKIKDKSHFENPNSQLIDLLHQITFQSKSLQPILRDKQH